MTDPPELHDALRGLYRDLLDLLDAYLDAAEAADTALAEHVWAQVLGYVGTEVSLDGRVYRVAEVNVPFRHGETLKVPVVLTPVGPPDVEVNCKEIE